MVLRGVIVEGANRTPDNIIKVISPMLRIFKNLLLPF
jgi:hypothetical protein